MDPMRAALIEIKSYEPGATLSQRSPYACIVVPSDGDMAT
jgi:hypothetical protein